MKINRLFSIAAATMMMVACSSEDTALKNTPAAGPQMQFTATIAAPGSGATTRTIYTEDTQNKKITVAWKVGDEIALVHNGVKDVATVKTINSDGSATITGYVTGATDGAKVRLVYPASLVKEAKEVTGDNDGTEYTADETVEGKLKTQGGTLAYIQDNLDFREVKGQLAVNGSEVTLKSAVKLESCIAIWKLTLSDGTNNLSATQVKIKGGESVLASTTTLTAGTSVVTLAIRTDVFIDGALTIEATVGSETYAYTKAEGATFNPGKYYQSTVNMTMVKTIDLSELQGDCEAKNGYTLTGTLTGNYKISIAAGATVTLDGVTIIGVDNNSYSWAGLNCAGDATIILKDETTNTVKGFKATYPGIHVLPGNTLIIKGETQGTGKLIASSNKNNQDEGAAGIGGGYGVPCGNIEIQGGDITATGEIMCAGIGGGGAAACGNITISGGTIKATGGSNGAGIGSGGDSDGNSSCVNITISGGTITAKSLYAAAGIGSGLAGTCGTITITDGVTQVTATKGEYAKHSIGAGADDGGSKSSCGTVKIGGVEGAITTSSYTYPVTYPVALSAVTGHYIGSVVTTDGNVYATVADATAASKTAVAMIAYVGTASDCAHGLAIALADESSSKMTWNTAKSTCSGKTPTITGGTWRLPSIKDWQYMFIGCGASGSYSDSPSSMSYSGLASKLTTAQGGGFQTAYYWSSTEDNPEHNPGDAFYLFFVNGTAVFSSGSENECRVRACLAF